jgi:hypothetical protein
MTRRFAGLSKPGLDNQELCFYISVSFRRKRKIMSANASTHSVDDASILERPRPFDMILYGGLVVGILDGLFALVFYGLILGAKPMRIFQSVASGLLGKASYEGGIQTFLLGILLHFIVASCIAAVYYVASLKLPVLIHHAVVCGLIYGMLAYLGMNYVVIPLSAIGSRPFSLRLFLPAFIGHALLVGLPIALLARRSAKANKRDYRNLATK